MYKDSKMFRMGVYGVGNHEQLVWTNHDFVHKSEVDRPHVTIQELNLYLVIL